MEILLHLLTGLIKLVAVNYRGVSLRFVNNVCGCCLID